MKRIDFSPANENCFITCFNNKIEIFETINRNIYGYSPNFLDEELIDSVSFSHDGEHVIFVNDNMSKLNIISYENVMENVIDYIFNLETDRYILNYTLSPNKNQIGIIYCLNVEAVVTMYDVEGRVVIPPENQHQFLIQVYSFDTLDARLIFERYINTTNINIAISEYNTLAISGDRLETNGTEYSLNIFDLDTGNLIKYAFDPYIVRSVHFVPENDDGFNKILVVLNIENNNEEHNFQIIDSENFEVLEDRIIDRINCVHIKRDGEITIGTSIGLLHFRFDGIPLAHRRLFHGEYIQQITYSLDGTKLGLILGQTLVIFDLTLDRFIHTIEEPGQNEDDQDENYQDEDDDDLPDEPIINDTELDECFVRPADPAKLALYGNKECLLLANNDEQEISTFLSANLNNIVLFYKQPADDDFSAFCLTFRMLKRFFIKPRYVYFNCDPSKPIEQYRDELPEYIRISKQRNIYVSYPDIKRKYIERQNMIFLVFSEKIESAVSYYNIAKFLNESAISEEWSCQKNTSIDVYRIIV